ncbi:MAG: chromophore lyase CpcT/CpeT [Gammaproteobacteria bacterium]
MRASLQCEQRRSELLVTAVILMLLSACSTTPQPTTSLELAKLATYFEGHFDTHAKPGSRTSVRHTLSRQRVTAPALGEHVYYSQSNRGQKLKLYRQRILVLEADTSTGQIVQRSFTLNNPEKFIDARTGDPVLSGLTANDIQPLFDKGCDQFWAQTKEDFYGYVDPSTCRVFSKRRNEYRRIETETRLSRSGVALAERGFDNQMNQEFGMKPGEALFLHRAKAAMQK